MADVDRIYLGESWTLEHDSPTEFAVIDRDRMTVMELRAPIEIRDEKALAVAQLLAAAPELLEALQALAAVVEDVPSYLTDRQRDHISAVNLMSKALQARVAIAKARGEAVPA